MPIKEKNTRNDKIYCEKHGFKTPLDIIPTKLKLSYKDLILKYKLSMTRLQQIVNKKNQKYAYIRRQKMVKK